MRKIFVGIFALSMSAILAFGADGKALAKKFKLGGSEKATTQWIRLFGNNAKMEKMGIVGLNNEEKKVLLEYLIKHAADSDAPAVAGI